NFGMNQQWVLFVPNTTFVPEPSWSGYAAEANLSQPQADSVSFVTGSWIVPTVTGPSSGTTDSAVWVGIDGFSYGNHTNNTVEQIGTDQEVINGTAVYFAWWEMYSINGPDKPGRGVQAPINSMTILPGDSITASVQYFASGPHA